MDGMMGGMGKGKGKGGGPKPEPKQIAVKTARKVMKEFRSVLTSEKALAEYDEARKAAPGEPAEDPGVPGPSKAAMDAILPIVHKLTKGISEKYGFTGGFDEAMASVDAASRRKGDKKIRDALDDIAEAITGMPSDKSKRIPELDKLADKFLDMGEAERKDAIAQAERVLDGLTVDGKLQVPSGTEYLDAMRGVVEKGDIYIEDSIVALSVIMREAAKGESEDQAEHEKRGVRLSVFSQFTRPKDYKRTNTRMPKGTSLFGDSPFVASNIASRSAEL
eukprot:gnl/TRDRNA2_/TRDRNA2_167522_c0_seq13.p1 gnl/TRDRNA2_/TRDRNA2_167522_c0~~gnl/TRDRNA2_/TRDRNA2_167522_c0_seq13.p1  ORF type:complete len:286 (+),score=69.41 gnl/TRDRNA2_/TRDRNA2_167522_c0_seq13:29-859(+)